MLETDPLSSQRTLQLLTDGVDKVEHEMAIILSCDFAAILGAAAVGEDPDCS